MVFWIRFFSTLCLEYSIVFWIIFITLCSYMMSKWLVFHRYVLGSQIKESLFFPMRLFHAETVADEIRIEICHCVLVRGEMGKWMKVIFSFLTVWQEKYPIFILTSVHFMCCKVSYIYPSVIFILYLSVDEYMINILYLSVDCITISGINSALVHLAIVWFAWVLRCWYLPSSTCVALLFLGVCITLHRWPIC